MTPLSSSSTPKPKQRVSSAAAATTPSIQTYLFKIRNEKEQIESIIAQTEALVAEQSRHRKLLGNDDARSEESCMLQIRMLENRLNDALVKFNTKVQGNKSLRDLIGEKRRDRCIYDEIYTKLEREMQRQSLQMRRELDQTKKTLELRHQAQKELEIAKNQLQENKAALELGRNELGKLREQLKDKEVAGEAEERSFRPKTTSANGSSVAPSTQEEDKFKDVQDDIQEEKKLDALLDQVMQLTGIDNVDTLIERLAEIEERNFSRFQYITELEAEVGRVENDIINAARELERLKNRGLNHQMQQINERELAKQKQQMLIDKSRDLDKQYEAQVELWEKMRKGIAQVHSALELPMPDDLLGSDGVSESNVFAYLAEIEKKTTDIISSINSDYDEDEGTTSLSPVACRGFAHDVTSKSTLIDLPSVKDAPADDGDRPFTFDELKSSLQL